MFLFVVVVVYSSFFFFFFNTGGFSPCHASPPPPPPPPPFLYILFLTLGAVSFQQEDRLKLTRNIHFENFAPHGNSGKVGTQAGGPVEQWDIQGHPKGTECICVCMPLKYWTPFWCVCVCVCLFVPPERLDTFVCSTKKTEHLTGRPESGQCSSQFILCCSRCVLFSVCVVHSVVHSVCCSLRMNLAQCVAGRVWTAVPWVCTVACSFFYFCWQFWFQIVNGFSGQILFERWSIAMYNVVCMSTLAASLHVNTVQVLITFSCHWDCVVRFFFVCVYVCCPVFLVQKESQDWYTRPFLFTYALKKSFIAVVVTIVRILHLKRQHGIGF